MGFISAGGRPSGAVRSPQPPGVGYMGGAGVGAGEPRPATCLPLLVLRLLLRHLWAVSPAVPVLPLPLATRSCAVRTCWVLDHFISFSGPASFEPPPRQRARPRVTMASCHAARGGTCRTGGTREEKGQRGFCCPYPRTCQSYSSNRCPPFLLICICFTETTTNCGAAVRAQLPSRR